MTSAGPSRLLAMSKSSRSPKKLDRAPKTKRSGWWIPSAEGGWTTPSEADWGKRPAWIPSSPQEQSSAK
jgi:hypothetical protein